MKQDSYMKQIRFENFVNARSKLKQISSRNCCSNVSKERRHDSEQNYPKRLISERALPHFLEKKQIT